LTEEGWRNSSSSQLLLGWLEAFSRFLRILPQAAPAKGRAAERTLRLFAAACCRQFGLLEPAAVALAERYAEGQAGLAPLPPTQARDHPVWSADAWVAAADTARLAAETAAARLAWPQPSGARDSPRQPPEGEMWAAADDAEVLLCRLLRDLWGNPLR